MLSRRALVRGAVGGGLALAVGGRARDAWPPAAAARAPDGYTRLRVVESTLTVDGKTGRVYRIEQDDGTLGYTGVKGQRFRVALENRTSGPTSIHWHGLILINGQDGVPYVTQRPLDPGEQRLYDFPLVQAGTYWMHSHFGLQEQPLMTAPLILRDPAAPHPEEHEVVVLLNDFTTRDPAAILAELQGRGATSGTMSGGSGMAGHDMSSMGKSQPAAPAGSTSPRTKMPMAGLDLNDVKYDAYLANRRPLSDPEIVRLLPWRTVLLRIINGASATNFFVSTGRLRALAIAIDGEDIVPFSGTSFELAISQRIDLRVTIPRGEGVYPVLAQGEGSDMLAGIVLATPDAAVPALGAKAPKAGALTGEQEKRLRAARPLPVRPVGRRLRVSLGGDMTRYVWMLNGQAWPKITPLQVEKGERVEVAFVNETGMGHPMHLHGHVFQVTEVGGKPVSGALRDTVYVLPSQAIKVQFDAAYPGYWMIHCHVVYHQAAGMMTVLHYAGFTNRSYDPLASSVEFPR